MSTVVLKLLSFSNKYLLFSGGGVTEEEGQESEERRARGCQGRDNIRAKAQVGGPDLDPDGLGEAHQEAVQGASDVKNRSP
jgi:hypothetical protein